MKKNAQQLRLGKSGSALMIRVGFSWDSIVRPTSSKPREEHMCWFSTEYANHVEDARAGQRLGIRTMHWHANWIVPETDLETSSPCAVCLQDGTRVLFRFSEIQQQKFHLSSEAQAVFKMLKYPKRDIFEFADGRQIALGDLPANLVLDVLVIPGSEQLSAMLGNESATYKEADREKESLLARLMAHFHRPVKYVEPAVGVLRES